MVAFYGSWVGNLRTRMELWASSQSTANNNSVVKQELWLETRNSAWFEDTTNRAMSIDGVSTGSANNNRYWAAGNTKVLSGQRTIGHNSDGTKTVRGITDFKAVYTGFINQTINQELALPAIARASIPTSENFTTGTATRITTNRKSSSFTHDITYKIGSQTGTIQTGVGVYYDWTPSHNLATLFPNAASASIEITVVTKNGSTTVGSSKITKTLTAGSTVVPVVGGVTWTDDNTTVRNNIGAFVQGKSLVKGTLTGVTGALTSTNGVYSSTVANDGNTRRTIVDGVEAAHGTTFQVNKSGTITASGKVTDSRGRVGTKAANFTQLAYTDPKIERLSAFRANSSGTATRDGTYIRLNIRAAVHTLPVSSVQKNSITIGIRTRPAGGGWTNRTSLTTSALSYDTTSVAITGGTGVNNFLASTSYDVEITLTDKTGTSVTQTTSVSTAAVTLDMNGTNVGIGKMREQGALDVGPGGIFDNGARVLNNSDIEMLNLGTQDLNTITSPGYRFQGADANATTARNYPITRAGALEVLPNTAHNFLVQRYTDYFSLRTFIRRLYSGGWTAWKELATYDGLPAATETASGIVERATQAEVNTGTDTTRYVSPATLRSRNYAPWAMAAGQASPPTNGWVTVTLPSGRFTQAPRIVGQVVSGSQNAIGVHAMITNVTTTSFQTRVSGANSFPVDWHAVQMTSSSANG